MSAINWSHNDLRNWALLALSDAGWLCWANNTGFGWTYDKKRPLRAGLGGSTDILAVKPPDGKLVGVEIKMEGDTLRDNQQRFRDAVLRVGGEHYVIRERSYQEDMRRTLNNGG